MRQYEIMFIVKPDIEEAEIKKTADSMKKVLTDKKAKIIEEIDQIEGFGKVKVNGETWKAIADNSTATFEIGETVVIKAVDGVKLIIEKEN